MESKPAQSALPFCEKPPPVNDLKAPFVYFGGKATVAQQVWERGIKAA